MRGGIAARAIHRHTALIVFLSVAQYVLAYLAEVDIQVAAVFRRIGTVARINKGVEKPELHIFDVRLLKVVGVELAHHSRPFLLGHGQRTVGIEVG